MAESYPKGLKTLWEKEKLLVTSNFSFSHSVLKRLVLQTRKNQGLFWERVKAIKELQTTFMYMPVYYVYRPRYGSLFMICPTTKNLKSTFMYLQGYFVEYVWTCSPLSRVFVHLTLSKTTNFRLFQSERVCRRQFLI